MIVRKERWEEIRDGIRALFVESFGRPIGEDYLDWRYFLNDSERFHFSIEASEIGTLASYSAFPVRLAASSQVFESAMSMTTMTHPAARGRGLFQALASELYSDLSGQRVGLVWGFPNANSHLTFVSKLGWKDIYEIPTLVLSLGGGATGAFQPSDRVVRDDGFRLDYDEAPQDRLIRVQKSRSYLQWRYARNPVNRYENFVLLKDGRVSSFVVTKRHGAGIDLVDIQCASGAEAQLLLSHVVHGYAEAGMARFECWAPLRHWIHPVLERMGFKNSAPITYFGARELVDGLAPEGWTRFENWYLQMGDSDVY